jgi:type II secretory pathway component PulF
MILFALVGLSDFIRALLAWGLLWLAPFLLLSIAAFFLSTLPARRKEKARLFLDLLRAAILDGQSPERAIVRISETRERVLGARFHLVAAYIEQGCSLFEALHRVRGYLPPAVIGLLETSRESHDMKAPIQAARNALGGNLGKTGTALHYAFALMILMVPFALVLLPFLSVFIWPKLQQILLDMEVPVPPLTQLVFQGAPWLALLYGLVVVFLILAFYAYVRAPRNFKSPATWAGGAIDSLVYSIPWRRKRAQRYFSLALGLLLHAGVPEPAAFERAGESSGSRFLTRRARTVAAKMSGGLALPKAIRFLDDSGELEWRLRNALQTGGDFLSSLRGWPDSLENVAWRAAETAAQFFSAAIILVNGLLVGGIISAVFLILISIINAGILW